MKKFLSFLLVIMFVFSLSACDMSEKENGSDMESISFSSTSEDGGFEDNSKDTADNEIDIAKENFPSYDEVQAEYPDKTVLVWAISKFGSEHYAPFHTRKVNEYLDEQGCDFAVCFAPVKFEHTDRYPRPLIPEIKGLLESGERIDIISPLNCDEFAFDGLYEPLDEYLETDAGRELYGALPEKLWESLRINGGIYWLSGWIDDILSADGGYYVNAELAEKYGYDVTKPILEQLDILRDVKENEKDTDVFSTYMRFDSIAANVNVKTLSSAVYWNGETHSAELSIDNAEYIESLRLYDTMQKEQLLNNMGTKHSSDFFIMADNVFGGGIAYADGQPIEVDYFGNTVTAIPVFTAKTAVRTSGSGTGICSKSEHKDKAFELLAKVFSDPILNNLLVYGVEGENYTLENGVAKEIEDVGDYMFNIDPSNTMHFANEMICHRSAYNLFTPEQYAEIFEKAEVYADSDFTLDPTSIISELNAEYIAADKLFLPNDNQSLDDVLSEYREGLYAAGVQKIIDECNRQYEVYKNEKNR